MVKDYSLGPADNYVHRRQVEMIGEGRHVLDFGCHRGDVASALRGRGCTVTGIEVDPVAAEAARDFCESVIVGDLDEMDLISTFEGRRYDVCLFGDVLEHLKDPWRVLRQAGDLLSPGGYVVVSVPNVAHASIRLMLLKGDFRYEDMGIMDDGHLRFFTRRSIGDLLESCGFIVEVMDWAEVTVPPLEIRKVLDPLGLANLEEVVEAFSDWEATAFQYIIKAFPATEEGYVNRLSEEKVQAEREAREMRARNAELEEKLAESDKARKWAEELQEQIGVLRAELVKSGEYCRELEKLVEESEAELAALKAAAGAKEGSEISGNVGRSPRPGGRLIMGLRRGNRTG